MLIFVIDVTKLAVETEAVKVFKFEIEVTMKISKMNLRIYEVGISYQGRTYAEGKKIKFIDLFADADPVTSLNDFVK